MSLEKLYRRMPHLRPPNLSDENLAALEELYQAEMESGVSDPASGEMSAALREQLRGFGIDPNVVSAKIKAGGNTANLEGGVQEGTLSGVNVEVGNVKTETTSKDVTESTSVDETESTSLDELESTSLDETGSAYDKTGDKTTTGSEVDTTDLLNEKGEHTTTTNLEDLVGSSKTTTGVDDTLGLGDLITGATPGIAGGVDARNQFLTGLVSGESQPQFSRDVQNAVNTATSGPGMVGAGQGANARAAGMAAQGVAQNQLQNQLAGASELGKGTGLEGLVSAGQGLLGRTEDTNFGQTVSNLGEQFLGGWDRTQGTQTKDFNMLDTFNESGSEGGWNKNTTSGTNTNTTSGSNTNTSSGTNTNTTSGDQTTTNVGLNSSKATGANTGFAFGEAPLAKTSGGCVICTAQTGLGLWKHLRMLRLAVNYKLTKPSWRRTAQGYFTIGTWIAKQVLKHPRLGRFLLPFTRAIVYEEVRLVRPIPFKFAAWFWHALGCMVCWVIGVLKPSENVSEPRLIKIGRKFNIWYEKEV